METNFKKGRHISTTSSNDGSEPIHYNLVNVNVDPVGAGIYVGESTEFIMAIIKNAKGEKEIINAFQPEHPSDKGCVEELERTYTAHFS